MVFDSRLLVIEDARYIMGYFWRKRGKDAELGKKEQGGSGELWMG